MATMLEEFVRKYKKAVGHLIPIEDFSEFISAESKLRDEFLAKGMNYNTFKNYRGRARKALFFGIPLKFTCLSISEIKNLDKLKR